MTNPVRCPVCNGEVTVNARAEILAHTRQAKHERAMHQGSEVCPGSRKGARP